MPSLDLGAVPSPGGAVRHRPPRRGGWWHAYVCPVHHTELVPGVGRPHRCPHGCAPTGEPYDSAALVYHHQADARRLRVAARGAAEGDPAAADEARTLAVRLLDLHAAAGTGEWNTEAAPWMLRGKLFHQALTEAIWAANVGHGLWTLQEAGLEDPELADRVTRFATAVIANVTDARTVLVDERDEFAHNYTAWLNAAGAVSAWLLDADTGRSAWLDGPSGQFAHILAATGADGWEWEGATYYHVFVLRAYLLSLRGVAVGSLPSDVRDRLGRMLAVLPAVAAADGRLPALHDSPYRRHVSDQETLEVVAIGRQLVDLPGLDLVAVAARASLGEHDDGLDRSLGDWLSGDAASAAADLPGRGSHDHFPDVGYTVLRGSGAAWRAVLDHGPHGGAHGHLDKLALYVESAAAWQPDPGITPYASAMRAHYTSTLAHPTFRVDGADQNPCTGRVERFEVTGGVTTLVASAHDAYPGVRAWRTLHLADDWLLDVVDLAVADGTDHDLVLQFRPAVPIEARAQGSGRFVVRWQDPAGDLVTWHLGPGAATTRLVPLPGPADDPVDVVTGLDWSLHGPSTRFVTVWQPAGVDDPVVRVDLDDDVVHVHKASGTTVLPLSPLPTPEPQS